MSRLTYTDEELKEFYDMDCPVRDNPLVERFCNEVCAEFTHDCPYKEMGKRLKAFEDLEEQGLLLRLPCKVGDKVWVITSPANYSIGRYAEKVLEHSQEKKIHSVTITKDDILYHVKDRAYSYLAIGKTVFLTKEEAEKKLASMQKGE